LFLYCTSGFRSSKTAEKLYNKGFFNIYNLEGGITAWRKEGMPVQKGKARRAEGKGRKVKNRATL
jgi:rhodanese-related sulfurtransferase